MVSRVLVEAEVGNTSLKNWVSNPIAIPINGLPSLFEMRGLCAPIGIILILRLLDETVRKNVKF